MSSNLPLPHPSSAPSIPSISTPPPLLRLRYKVSLACDPCRLRKLKCDGRRPACSRCQQKDSDSTRANCRYSARFRPRPVPPADGLASPGPPSSQSQSQSQSQVPSLSESTLTNAEESGGVEADALDYTSGKSGFTGFATEVKRVIDARLGLPFLHKKPCPTPMINTPLFGSLHVPPKHTSDDGAPVHLNDGLLPPRKHGDRLMDSYWRRLHPLEPLLDQERFSRAYEALYAGSDLGFDERIFMSTLNTVFALSTQLQESVQPAEQRDEAGKAFFLRAWSLLRPETVIWESGSLEVVQCMLLMCRFTQCTNNPLTTWMLVGSAVRVAQSLGLHLPDSSASSAPSRDAWLRRRVWLHCAYLDREISWTLDRASTVPLIASSRTIDAIHRDVNLLAEAQVGAPTTYMIKSMELQEITSHIMLSQVPTSSRFAESLGLSQSRQNPSDLSAAVAMDSCLKKWENGLPLTWRSNAASDPDPGMESEPTISQRILLRLRLAHARTLLFRSMLAQFCLTQQQQQQQQSPSPPDQTPSLGQGILRECASLSVDSARRMIDLVYDHYDSAAAATADPDPNAAGAYLLPWWHRIFYLFVASQHLLAAMLRPDAFPAAAAADALSKAFSVLRLQENLSPCVGRCVKSFETMWQKISDIHTHQGGQGSRDRVGVGAADGCAVAQASFFQDVFHDLGFDAESALFGMEDGSWFGHGAEGWNV